MNITASRRGFLRGIAGAAALGASGCFSIGRGRNGKIRLAAVGVMGKGYSDWTPMIKTGLAEMVAFCDADYSMREKAQMALIRDGIDLDMYEIPFYTDYRKLLDDAGILGIDAMTISTPDHAHAAIAIGAMKQGIHVYVQKPLVRTLWENKYFETTARENNVIVQMGNQGSSLNSMRRCTEVIQSGILGDVKEVHVWTNRPVWPQGKGVADWVKSHPKGDKVRPGLNWDAWLGTAKNRPFLDQYPKDADVYDPWNLGKNVYHTFTWRGFFDFGAGAFGDMACHTMNLAFRGLELGAVSDAVCTKIVSENDIAYPLKSVVKLTYKERESIVRPGVKLPAVTLYWYDGEEKPDASIMPKWASANGGKVPYTGCYIIGSKGAVLMQDDYGAKCALALNDDKKFVDIFKHEAAKAVPRTIPFCSEAVSDGAVGKSTVAMKGFAEGHYGEFLHAIRGDGHYYEQTHSRCFSDIEYCIPQMEGILVGCVAQQLPGKTLKWNSSSQKFDLDAANSLVKPYIRSGWGF
jgi:predicted dehydrogenase